jgi:hydrogenase expression/formation protein HypC
MCLGIVGRVVTLSEDRPELADVDVAGVVRPINVMMLAGDGLLAGDWILIHAGFAMERIDAETAARQIDALRSYTGPDAPGAGVDPFAGDGPFGKGEGP